MGFEFEKKRLYGLLGPEVVRKLKKYNCYLAGGAITSLFCNREVNDYDIYFRNSDDLIAFLYESWGENWIVMSTDKAITVNLLGKNVQLIHFKYFDNAYEIFNTFDFTVCMGAFDFVTESFVLHPDFLHHNSQRILKFNPNTAFPIVSLLRVAKYQEKGYEISKSEFIKIILTCMNLKIESYDDLKHHLGGMYGINYDRLFDEIKDEQFSLSKAIDYISKLSYDDSHFEKYNVTEISSVEDLLKKIQGKIKYRYFKLPNGNDFYIVYPDETIRRTREIPEDTEDIIYREIPYTDFFSETKLYKFVKKTDNGEYQSFYDSSYYYKIGEEAVPDNNYLYLTTFENLKYSTYAYNSNKACLEVEFEPEDIAMISYNKRDIFLKKCHVIREVPKEEWKVVFEEDDA